MRKFVLTLFAAGAALARPGVASAETASVSVEQIYDAGRCIVDRDRSAAVSLLHALPVEGGSADMNDVPPNLAARCARGISAANALHLRGALAQALFFRDFGAFGVEPRRSVPMVDLNLPVQADPPGPRTVELYRWADCIVRNDSHHTERLLASSVGSRAESEAISRMRPYMTACAPAGAELTVQASELRSVLAQSAYHSLFRYWTRDLDPVRDQ